MDLTVTNKANEQRLGRSREASFDSMATGSMDSAAAAAAGQSLEVCLRVRVKREPGEVVCIVGSVPELGSWSPLHVKELHQVERRKH